MNLSRRKFLAASGTAVAGGILARIGLDLGASEAYAKELKTRRARESTTVCPYCAVGCGMIVSSRDGKMIAVEGDPDHPINRGALCCKGQALYEVSTSPRRLSKVLYRAPGSDRWEERTWEWAINRIADRIKGTRDQYFTRKDSEGRTVNRLDAIAALGGAALDNEECYLYGKLARALGIVYIEHQARI